MEWEPRWCISQRWTLPLAVTPFCSTCSAEKTVRSSVWSSLFFPFKPTCVVFEFLVMTCLNWRASRTNQHTSLWESPFHFPDSSFHSLFVPGVAMIHQIKLEKGENYWRFRIDWKRSVMVMFWLCLPCWWDALRCTVIVVTKAILFFSAVLKGKCGLALSSQGRAFSLEFDYNVISFYILKRHSTHRSS